MKVSRHLHLLDHPSIHLTFLFFKLCYSLYRINKAAESKWRGENAWFEVERRNIVGIVAPKDNNILIKIYFVKENAQNYFGARCLSKTLIST
jgi:hypothetical protein